MLAVKHLLNVSPGAREGEDSCYLQHAVWVRTVCSWAGQANMALLDLLMSTLSDEMEQLVTYCTAGDVMQLGWPRLVALHSMFWSAYHLGAAGMVRNMSLFA